MDLGRLEIGGISNKVLRFPRLPASGIGIAVQVSKKQGKWALSLFAKAWHETTTVKSLDR